MEGSGCIWTAFVDNLSRRVTRGALWELFNHYGKVTGIFIPTVNKKPRYKFSTFAFVQFASSGDLDRAIRSTNKSKIDGRFIVVSKARFTNTQKENILGIPQTNKKGDKLVGGSIRDLSKSVTSRYASVDNKSYKKTLLGKPKVHVANQEGNLQRTEEEIRGDSSDNPLNFYFPISDSAWIENDLVEKDVVWNEKKDALLFWFYYIAPLKNRNGIHASFLSISLTGVPLQCWHENFLKASGNKWREFIDLDESTKEKENFYIANFIFRAKSPFDVPESITIHCGK
ncbi:hypothetical protein V6N12_067074 [Hibiscus sabdariffa]|uniref:RRM domain-containing protein n=1 Tax=Hibiscus sabdariffa TaxID=183260 RepID=A0ABR1ZZA3_9ROSI